MKENIGLRDINDEFKTLKFDNLKMTEELNKLQVLHQNSMDKLNIVEKENYDYRQNFSRLYYLEDHSKLLQEQIEKLEKENRNIKEENYSQLRKFQIERETLQKKSELALIQQKFYIDSLNLKLGPYESIERLSNIQNKEICILEKELEIIDKSNKDKFENVQIKSEIKFSDFKNKIVDRIENTQKNVEKLNVIHMDVSTKLTMLQNNKMITQIDSLTKQVESLISKNKLNERIIMGLQQELSIHNRVEYALAEKNNYYINCLRDITDNINKNNKSNDLNNSITKDNIVSPKELNAKLLNENKSIIDNEIKFRNSNTKLFNRSNSQIYNKELHNKSLYQNQNLEKIIEKKQKDYDLLKLNYEIIQETFNSYEQKIAKIFKLIEEALNELAENSAIKKNNEIILNIDKIKNADFDSFSIEQKYSVLSILMKKLIPFILSDLKDENENLKNTKVFRIQSNSLNSTRTSNFFENKNKNNIQMKNSNIFPKRIKFSVDPIMRKKLNEKQKINMDQRSNVASIFI